VDYSLLFMMVGFLAASYSVIANDSVQTLGTFIASNQKTKWYWMWAGASAVLVATVVYGWYTHGGDISYGRLNTIPAVSQIQWYHALAPCVILLLTRRGIPVSTTFLVLSAFASTVVLEKMLMKSVVGYGLSAVCAFLLWSTLPYWLNEKSPANERYAVHWRIAQWTTTGFLWFTWLSHDMANIAVFLPRQLSIEWLVTTIGVLVIGLAYIFWKRGGKIQEIVHEKTSTNYVRSATFIDGLYAFVLLFFKQYNDIPMSTTWVFVGVLCGRELALAHYYDKTKIKKVWPLVVKDFLKMMVGLMVSVAIVLGIHYLDR
jgi:phosphate/sulfate permease